MADDNQKGNAQMSTRGAERRLPEVSSHTTKEPTMTHQSHPNDPPPAGDELLTISEVAAIVPRHGRAARGGRASRSRNGRRRRNAPKASSTPRSPTARGRASEASGPPPRPRREPPRS